MKKNTLNPNLNQKSQKIIFNQNSVQNLHINNENQASKSKNSTNNLKNSFSCHSKLNTPEKKDIKQQLEKKSKMENNTILENSNFTFKCSGFNKKIFSSFSGNTKKEHSINLNSSNMFKLFDDKESK